MSNVQRIIDDNKNQSIQNYIDAKMMHDLVANSSFKEIGLSPPPPPHLWDRIITVRKQAGLA